MIILYTDKEGCLFVENRKITLKKRQIAVSDRLKALKEDQKNNGIGNRIRELRKDQKLTGAELASLVNMSQSAISDIENGKRNIDSRDLPLFAAALDTTVDYICSGHSPETVNLALETGLSERAFETLKDCKSLGLTGISRLLNLLLYSAHNEDETVLEDIGQGLLHELSEYIFHDYSIMSFDIGTDRKGRPIKRTVTGRDIGLIKIKNCLDALSVIESKRTKNKQK